MEETPRSMAVEGMPKEINFKRKSIPHMWTAIANGDLDILQGLLENQHTQGEAKDETAMVTAPVSSRGTKKHHRMMSGTQNGITKTPSNPLLSKTPLHVAAETGNPNIIKFLLSTPEAKKIDNFDGEGYTPLHLACWFGHLKAVELLVEGKASLELQHPKTKMTALHFAAFSNGEKIVSFLLEKGAQTSAVDIDGRTPLHAACMVTASEVVRLLIRKKADLNAVDKSKKTPMDIVYDNNQFELLNVMTNNGGDISKLYDENWNGKLKQHLIENAPSKADSYGFYQHPDSEPNVNQAPIKPKHVLKWNSIIKSNMDEIPSWRKVRIIKRIYKDRLPNDVRSAFWKYCLQLEEKECLKEYEEYSNKLLPQEESTQIDKDVNRTIRYHQFYKDRYGEGQCKLFRVLKAYANYNSETRYTQGMSTIAGILLIYIPEEHLAFGALKELFSRYKLNNWYANGLDGLQKEVFPTLEKLISKYLPKLHHHLYKILAQGMALEHYCGLFITNWFLELFFDSLPWPLMLKVWDTFLWFGNPALYSIALALLEALEAHLLSLNDFSALVKELKNTGDFKGDQKKLLKRAFKFAIDEKQLEKIKAKVTH